MSKFSLPVDHFIVNDVGDNFLLLDLWTVAEGQNVNGSNFLGECLEPAIPTFYNKPILAYYNPRTNDVEEHNSRMKMDVTGEIFEDFQYEGGEKPVGVIPESAQISIETYEGKRWIVVRGAIIWSHYSKQLCDLIKKSGTKTLSVEVDFVDTYEEDGITMVRQFHFNGVTILGDDIPPGIPGAHLSLEKIEQTEQFSNYRKALCFAMQKKEDCSILQKYGIEEHKTMIGQNFAKEEFISKEEYGKGAAIKVDKSRSALSDTPWGDVNKSELRNKVLEASNYKSLVHDVYLKVESGWEDAPSEGLKYPVMQIKGDKAVYNVGGLLSAFQYGIKNDESVASKAESIRKKLGLAKSNKGAKMKEFINSAAKQGFAFVGIYKNKYRFAQSFTFGEDEDTEREEMKQECMSVFEIEKEKCGDEFKKEDCAELKMKSFDEDEEEDEDDDDIDVKDDKDKKKDKATYAKKFAAAEEKCRAAEKEKEKMATKLRETEAELKKMKDAEFADKMEKVFEEDKTDEETKKELKKMAEDGKFAAFEDFEKEYAYRKYKKDEEAKKETEKEKETGSFKFSAFYNGGNNKNNVDPLDMI